MSAVFGAISAVARGVVSFSVQKEEENVKNKRTLLSTKCNDKIQLPKKNSELEEIISNDSSDDGEKDLNPGPLVSLKEQIEKDKDDESLKKWKEQLLGRVDLSSAGESKEAEVKVLSLTIQRQGKEDLVLPIPFTSNSKNSLFTLKQGNRYRLKFTFTISKNIVSGLKYTNCVWKSGVRVDNSKTMLGTFRPQVEPYTYETKEEITPTIIFARGSYCVRTKFMDDDSKTFLDVTYYFDIAKNWPIIS